MSDQLLTHSSLSTMRRCARKYYLRYEMGLSRAREPGYFRMGSAFHLAQELHNGGTPQAQAVHEATAEYETCPEWADPQAWGVEYHTVQALLLGHFWRYSQDRLEHIASEMMFEQPLRNPETGATSRTFRLAGKIDGIVKLPDGPLAVLEYKTAGEDISPEGGYWLRLRSDAQISIYVLAARALGYDVGTVVYDATRKPTIAPKQIPVLDGDGRKIVHDEYGERVFLTNGKPRQSASKKEGFTLETTLESPKDFGERVLADLGERPDYYYQRHEIPRLDSDLAEVEYELWQQSKAIIAARQRASALADPAFAWFRNVGRWTCPFCEFADLCLQNTSIDPGCPPAGYAILDNVHPELEKENYHARSTDSAAADKVATETAQSVGDKRQTSDHEARIDDGASDVRQD